MSQAAPCVLAPLGRGHLGDPLWTECLGPTQGREVGFLRRAHTQTGKEDWLLFQTPWSPQENWQGSPCPAKHYGLKKPTMLPLRTPQGTRGGAPALSLKEQKDFAGPKAWIGLVRGC